MKKVELEKMVSCWFCRRAGEIFRVNGYETCSGCLSSRFDICVRCQGYALVEKMGRIEVDGLRRGVCAGCREQLEQRGCSQCGGRMQWQSAFISSTCESCGGLGYKEYLRMQEEALRSAQEDYEYSYPAGFRDRIYWVDLDQGEREK